MYTRGQFADNIYLRLPQMGGGGVEGRGGLVHFFPIPSQCLETSSFHPHVLVKPTTFATATVGKMYMTSFLGCQRVGIASLDNAVLAVF